jgi:hypothetical protein
LTILPPVNGISALRPIAVSRSVWVKTSSGGNCYPAGIATRRKIKMECIKLIIKTVINGKL